MMSTEDGLKWPVCSHTCTWLEFLSCGSQEGSHKGPERVVEGPCAVGLPPVHLVSSVYR